jgi:hypothetical protein
MKTKATVTLEGDLVYVTLPSARNFPLTKWKGRLELQGYHLWPDTQAVLEAAKGFSQISPRFVPRLVILRPSFWSESKSRSTEAVREEGKRRGWFENHPAITCSLRESLPDEEMKKAGLERIIGIHEPVYMKGDGRLLAVSRHDKGNTLATRWTRKGDSWRDTDGFAFSLFPVSFLPV